jgi:hypothetical protein
MDVIILLYRITFHFSQIWASQGIECEDKRLFACCALPPDRKIQRFRMNLLPPSSGYLNITYSCAGQRFLVLGWDTSY